VSNSPKEGLVSARQLKLLAIILVIGTSMIATAGQTAEDALKEFHSGIQRYLAIHRQASASVPNVPPTVRDPAIIIQHEQELARAIRALRANAERGDIFTRKVRTLIANTINLKVDENGRNTILGGGNPRSDASPATISLAVNAVYPATAPLATVPPSLLIALPPLPPELEYRFVGHTLILRDRRANIIVDIMTDAI
jgi:hypothetical protein